jgi:hypothetical protein
VVAPAPQEHDVDRARVLKSSIGVVTRRTCQIKQQILGSELMKPRNEIQ